MKIAISAETTVDLPKELLQKHKIHTVPFTLVLGEKTFLDGEITPQQIFDYVEKTGKLPKTSAVNEYQYDEHFSNLLKEYDAIIHFSLSSDMSSAYKNACASASKHPGVIVVDSRSLSTGIALLCYYASKLVDEGVELNEIVSRVQDRINADQASFVLEKVNYLYKGGRCSTLAFIGANILGLKPQIIVKDGKMVPGRKYRGNIMKVTMQYVDDTLEAFSNPDLSQVFITYTTATPEIVEAVKTKLINRGFKNIDITNAGGTITCHCGEHCLGILYINDGEH